MKLLNYPRRRPSGWTRWLPSLRLWVLGVFLVVAAVVGLAGYVYASTDIPSGNPEAAQQTNTYYYADARTVIATEGDFNRVSVSLDQVPLTVQHAVVAAENRSFYRDRGVSPTGIARAAWNNLRGGSTQGGSTITQQYVKNYYLNADRTWQRKLREIAIAVKIDRQESKDQILEDYLNTIYFGRGAYGIQAASQAYFGVDVGTLTPQQGAVLAAVIRSPGNYDPSINADLALSRFRYVLSGMRDEGWLDASIDPATATLPKVRARSATAATSTNQYAGQAGYLWQAARSDLLAKKVLTEDDLDRGGYKIVTSFDRQRQQEAVNAVEKTLVPLQRDTDNLHAALAATDPRTGEVVAIYGGSNYLKASFNYATQGVAQPGSTFKAFTLVAALEHGISLRSTFNGNPDQTFAGYLGTDGRPQVVTNDDEDYYGYINLVTATADSVNTAFVNLIFSTKFAGQGPQDVVDVARRAGIPSSVAIDPTPSVTLGVSSVHTVDMAQAYGVFAANGVQNGRTTLTSVSTYTGDKVWTWHPEGLRVWSADVDADVTYALRAVTRYGTASNKAYELDRPFAGKTGTSEGRTAWFVGYTPQLSVAVSLFRGDESGEQSIDGVGGRASVTGNSYPLTMWLDFANAALEGTPELDFPDRADVGSYTSGTRSYSSPSPSRRSRSTRSPRPYATSTSSGTSDDSTGAGTGTTTVAPTTEPTSGSGDGSGGDSGEGTGGATGEPTAEPTAAVTARSTSRATSAATTRSQARLTSSPQPRVTTRATARSTGSGSTGSG